MAIDLLLIESPIRELVPRQHHIDSGHRMLQLEVVGLGSQDLSLVTINQAQMEQGLVITVHLVLGQGSELLVGGIARGSDIVGHQERVCVSVEELDDVVMADNPSTASLREGLGRNDNPAVVLIFMGVTSDLLTLTADSLIGVIAWITLRVRVQQVLGVNMLDRNGVEITNFWRRRPISASPVTASGPDTPWLFISNSLPIKVSWNAGDMNVSPVPEWVRMAK